MELELKQKRNKRFQLLLTQANYDKLNSIRESTGLSCNEIINQLIELAGEEQRERSNEDFINFFMNEIPEIYEQLKSEYDRRNEDCE